MIYRLDPDYPGFPNPEEAEPDGLLAIGGDLSAPRLINAYCCGIFPWFSDGEPIMWWSLDPRMYEVRIDQQFEEVMRHCANVSRIEQHQYGTWITESMIEAYVRLHRLGLAHSFETYHDGNLVGGLYGLSLGPFFFGESMFHTMTDASKVAFVRLVEFCKAHGFRLIDAQQETEHLSSLGARPIPRGEYLKELNAIRAVNTLQGNWSEIG